MASLEHHARPHARSPFCGKQPSHDSYPYRREYDPGGLSFQESSLDKSKQTQAATNSAETEWGPVCVCRNDVTSADDSPGRCSRPSAIVQRFPQHSISRKLSLLG